MEPVNGKNPLVAKVKDIHLPMPGEIPEEWDEDDDDEEYEDMEDQELPEPQSEDEQYAGVNRPPPAARDYSGVQPPKKKKRLPPMPKAPKPKRAKEDAWVPPFEVLPDGTVVGPTAGDGDVTRLPPGFDPPKGTFEGVTSIFRPPGSR